MEQSSVQQGRRDTLRKVLGLTAGASMISITGCSKMLLASGKLLFGDPKQSAEFTVLTKENLAKGTKTVLVACSASESVEANSSTLKLDLIDGITRRMTLNGVKTVNPDRVADWVDNHGGVTADPSELARDFDTDYIAWIDVQTFDIHEPNSPKLLRGNASGFIRVFKVDGDNSMKRALKVYQTEFALTYPLHQPISEQGRSSTVFYQDYVKHLSELLAERFYDHRPGSKF